MRNAPVALNALSAGFGDCVCGSGACGARQAEALGYAGVNTAH
jgi:hypothetical protein